MSSVSRTEWKYLIDRATMGRLIGRWSPWVRGDEHAGTRQAYPVLSQYFDTPDLSSCQDKIEGEARRVKFRLRAYGFDFESASRIYLEVKQRSLETMYKLREPLEMARDHRFACLGDVRDGVASDEMRALLERSAPLVPTAQTFFMREAFRALGDPRVRVTFDSWLLCLLPGERFDQRMPMRLDRQLLDDETYVLEVKKDQGAETPSWLEQGLLAEGLRRRTFSKYAQSMKRLQKLGWKPEEPVSGREG